VRLAPVDGLFDLDPGRAFSPAIRRAAIATTTSRIGSVIAHTISSSAFTTCLIADCQILGAEASS
jgi:hypothetical protein